MTAHAVHPVILCGGSGTRLWPLSRRALPKQFLPLLGGRTLLQETVLRAAGIGASAPPIVVSNHDHRFLVAEQLDEIGVRPAALLVEPVARNTAPAVAAAALHVARADAEALLLVLPSDHAVREAHRFQEAVAAASGAAADGFLATFGMRPTEPSTGYGYIEIGEPIEGRRGAFRIRKFVEKPDRETAVRLLSSQRYLWNGGMFVFKARRLLDELARWRPHILEAASKALAAATRDLDFLRLGREEFSACASESIDHAVMEHTQFGAVVPCDMGWSDVGSWSALWQLGAKDTRENVARGDVQLRDASRCYVWANRLVYLLGVNDLIVADTDDALLIAHQERAQEVKDVVAQLDGGSRTEHVSHSVVYRPWGHFETLDAGPGFQVKRIVVKPGQALSLQMHRHRAEHWVVVSGKARVTCDERVFDLAENQSTFIPLGSKHRLENPGVEPLSLIEVQSGSYLGEDDIVRFDDRYSRT